MFCIKCGKVLDSFAEICPYCGTKVILPEGFEPDNGAGNIDIDMLVGEKTVSADHSAIARKAAAAANAQTAPDAPMAAPAMSEPVFSAPASIPVAEPSVPHSPAGFDLDKAKKIMNGRSILIDDSPITVASPVVDPISAPVAEKKSEPAPADKKTKLVVIVAAIVAVLTIFGTVLAVALLGGDDDSDNEEASGTTVSETITEEITTEESTTKVISNIGEIIPGLSPEQESDAEESVESTTEEFRNNPIPTMPDVVKPEKPSSAKTDEENTTLQEATSSGSVLPPTESAAAVNPEPTQIQPVADGNADDQLEISDGEEE